MRKPLLVLAVFAFAAIGVQCGSCNEKALEDSGKLEGGTPISQLTAEQKAQVLARVGDRTITLGDYAAALEHMDQFDRMRYASPERRKELLDEMIEVELLAREAEAKGYDKDPVSQMETRAILREAMLKDAHKGAPGPSDIPDDEVRAYYEAHKDDYKDPERRRLSLIVLKDEPTAKAVLGQALATTNASQWGELVRTKSIDAQAKASVPIDLAGDFGFVSPPGDQRGENPRVPEPVRAAAFEISSVGQVLGRVVPGGDGRFYLVRLSQKVDAHARSFGEAERSIRVKLAQDKIKQKEDEMLASLRAQYPVQIDESALAKVHVDLPDAGR
jgi:parvulin-like peptidyl-prolyl isomerase